MSDGPKVIVDSERLNTCRSMVAKMCSEGRPPRMSIPADRERDEDLFIIDTLMSVESALAAEREKVARLEAEVASLKWNPEDGKCNPDDVAGWLPEFIAGGKVDAALSACGIRTDKLRDTFKRAANTMRAEKKSRVFYQGLVYKACNAVDEGLGRCVGNGTGTTDVGMPEGVFELAAKNTALAAEREKVAAVTETWLAVAAERDAARAEVDRLNHEEAEWFTAHARGFRDADRGILLTDCKEETRNAATAWACGWLERAWQKRYEEADSQRTALADRVRGMEGALRKIDLMRDHRVYHHPPEKPSEVMFWEDMKATIAAALTPQASEDAALSEFMRRVPAFPEGPDKRHTVIIQPVTDGNGMEFVTPPAPAKAPREGGAQ